MPFSSVSDFDDFCRKQTSFTSRGAKQNNVENVIFDDETEHFNEIVI